MITPFSFSGRLFTIGFLFVLLAMLTFLAIRADHDQRDIHERTENYRTFQVFDHVHIHGDELSLRYLPFGKDSLLECEANCLEQERCLAIDYLPPNPKTKNPAQCWLSSDVDNATNNPCCTLAVRSSSYAKLEEIKKALKRAQEKLEIQSNILR